MHAQHDNVIIKLYRYTLCAAAIIALVTLISVLQVIQFFEGKSKTVDDICDHYNTIF